MIDSPPAGTFPAARASTLCGARARSEDTMAEFYFRTDARDEARALVLEHHYSHSWPRRIVFALTWHVAGGLFGDRGEAVAAAAFGCPNVLWREPVIELQRLVRTPDLTMPLTSLLSAAVKELYHQLGDELIISYADPNAGHHGGIYQAASWRYAGAKPPARTGCYIGGSYVHRRTLNHQYGTSSPRLLRERLAVNVAPVVAAGKHLYWKALNRRGKAKAKRLGLDSLPYPKPGW